MLDTNKAQILVELSCAHEPGDWKIVYSVDELRFSTLFVLMTNIERLIRHTQGQHFRQLPVAYVDFHRRDSFCFLKAVGSGEVLGFSLVDYDEPNDFVRVICPEQVGREYHTTEVWDRMVEVLNQDFPGLQAERVLIS